MHIPKRYGQSKVDPCPVCGKQATTTNNGIPVCTQHKNSGLPDFTCACGSYLELKQGKWGAYFHCMNCGNISMKKALELNPLKSEKESTEYSITSDDVDLHYS